MSIAEMQACLARLYIDDSFRNLFYIDTAAAVQEYLLTEAESAAISKINRRMLDFFAESLKRKRKEKLQRAYPALFALERAEIDRYYRRYYQLYTANPHQNNLQDVSDFGIFMEETLARADALPPYASDLAKYERLYYSVRFTPTINNNLNAHDDANDEQATVTSMDARPVLREGVRLHTFKYSVGEIEEVLQQGRAPNELELQSGEYPIVFLPGANRSIPKMFRLNAASKTLLDLCDGRRVVSNIVEEAEALFQADNLQDAIVESLNRLLALRLITI